MMNILIIAIMIITLMGAATYGLVGAMRSLQTGIENLLVEDRLEEAAQGIVANIVSVTSNGSQVYYVPAPDNLTTPAVPSWITPNAQTLRGVKFWYCPFSNALGSGSQTISTPSSSYTVNIGTTYAGTNISSNNYVTQSSARPTYPSTTPSASPASTVLAILVAPGPGQSSVTQDCLNISASGTLPGATVRIITEQEVQSRAQVTASYGNEFYAASSTSSDGKATSQNNYAALATVMDYVNKYRPQRVTVDLNPGDTLNVAAADLDQTTVLTRQFSAARNHSILFNGNSSSNLEYGSAGTLSPVVLGNVEFNNVIFPANSGSLLRPMADSFGNVMIADTASGTSDAYAAAENLGRIILPYNSAITMGRISGSPTGAEMYYTQRGGLLTEDSSTTLNGPANNYPGYLIYNDWGGNTNLNPNTNMGVTTKGTGSGAPFFSAGGGIFSGSINYSNASDNNIFSILYGDLGSRIFTQTINSSNSSAIAYVQGGLVYNSSLSTYAGVSPYGNNPSYDFLAGAGSNFVLNHINYQNTTTTDNATINVLGNSNTSPYYQAATFAAGNPNSAAYFKGATSGPGCFSDLKSYNLASDTGNAPVSSLSPRGNIGMEATIILNRASGVCD
jgi:hypothetical protein